MCGSRQHVEERHRPVGDLASSELANSWFEIGDLTVVADAEWLEGLAGCAGLRLASAAVGVRPARRVGSAVSST
jgi:hypothetical protein